MAQSGSTCGDAITIAVIVPITANYFFAGHKPRRSGSIRVKKSEIAPRAQNHHRINTEEGFTRIYNFKQLTTIVIITHIVNSLYNNTYHNTYGYND